MADVGYEGKRAFSATRYLPKSLHCTWSLCAEIGSWPPRAQCRHCPTERSRTVSAMAEWQGRR